MQGLEIYEEHSDEQVLSGLFRSHSSLVYKIAKNIKRKLPSHIELNDLLQSGFIGLIEAGKSFKKDQGASFETFASIRIRGAIIDQLRKNSWNSREAAKNMKEIGEATHRVEQKNKRPATAEEISAEMNITQDDYDSMCQMINVCNMLNMDDLESLNLLPGDDRNPEALVIEENTREKIKKILLTMQERERILLSLYYIEELTFREISEILDLTEARVCQIHATAIAKIKKRL